MRSEQTQHHYHELYGEFCGIKPSSSSSSSSSSSLSFTLRRRLTQNSLSELPLGIFDSLTLLEILYVGKKKTSLALSKCSIVRFPLDRWAFFLFFFFFFSFFLPFGVRHSRLCRLLGAFNPTRWFDYFRFPGLLTTMTW